MRAQTGNSIHKIQFESAYSCLHVPNFTLLFMHTLVDTLPSCINVELRILPTPHVTIKITVHLCMLSIWKSEDHVAL